MTLILSRSKYANFTLNENVTTRYFLQILCLLKCQMEERIQCNILGCTDLANMHNFMDFAQIPNGTTNNNEIMN